jgi:hypothetical protein
MLFPPNLYICVIYWYMKKRKTYIAYKRAQERSQEKYVVGHKTGSVVASSDSAQGEMERGKAMLIVCGIGKKGGGKRETNSQAIREKKEGKLQEGKREMEKAVLEGREIGKCRLEVLTPSLPTCLAPKISIAVYLFQFWRYCKKVALSMSLGNPVVYVQDVLHYILVLMGTIYPLANCKEAVN